MTFSLPEQHYIHHIRERALPLKATFLGGAAVGLFFFGALVFDLDSDHRTPLMGAQLIWYTFLRLWTMGPAWLFYFLALGSTAGIAFAFGSKPQEVFLATRPLSRRALLWPAYLAGAASLVLLVIVIVLVVFLLMCVVYGPTYGLGWKHLQDAYIAFNAADAARHRQLIALLSSASPLTVLVSLAGGVFAAYSVMVFLIACFRSARAVPWGILALWFGSFLLLHFTVYPRVPNIFFLYDPIRDNSLHPPPPYYFLIQFACAISLVFLAQLIVERRDV